MELFSEVYGCYFAVVSKLLGQAGNGLTKEEIEAFVSTHGFYDSTFHLLPSLHSGEWNLLHKEQEHYYSKLFGDARRPFTVLEKAWLKAIMQDSRIRLFLDDTQYQELAAELADIEPLFCQDDFHIYDQHLDGDDFSDPDYRACFQIIRRAIRDKMALFIEYRGGSGKRTRKLYYPYQLNFSDRDNKFRVKCTGEYQDERKLKGYILNLSRIMDVRFVKGAFPSEKNLQELEEKALGVEPVILEISEERNALERCMMQFASFKRHTEYDRERDVYTCRIWYSIADETELLIRILSFGPVVKVLGPEPFLQQVKERVRKQLLMGFYNKNGENLI